MSKAKVNAKSLFHHAHDVMMLLKKGEIDVDAAKAHAQLLKQSNNFLRYELDRAVTLQKYDALAIRDIEDLDE